MNNRQRHEQQEPISLILGADCQRGSQPEPEVIPGPVLLQDANIEEQRRCKPEHVRHIKVRVLCVVERDRRKYENQSCSETGTLIPQAFTNCIEQPHRSKRHGKAHKTRRKNKQRGAQLHVLTESGNCSERMNGQEGCAQQHEVKRRITVGGDPVEVETLLSKGAHGRDRVLRKVIKVRQTPHHAETAQNKPGNKQQHNMAFRWNQIINLIADFHFLLSTIVTEV